MAGYFRPIQNLSAFEIVLTAGSDPLNVAETCIT